MPDSRSELDDRLVAALKAEPRATVLSLANTTGFPRAVVASRLKELQESGDLKIVAATHPLLNGPQLIAHVAFAIQGPVTPVLEYLSSLEESVFVSTVTGEYEAVMEVRLKDQEELQSLLSRVRAFPGITRTTTMIYSSVVKGYLSHNSFDDLHIDGKDRQLIASLGADGRKSWQELADVVGLSPSAVRTRVHRLLDSNVLRIVVMERGGRYGRVMSIGAGLILNGDTGPVLQKVLDQEEIEFAIAAIGRYDAVLVIRAHGSVALFDCLERLREVPEIIKIETWTHLRQAKEDFARLL
ncbi:MAG: Lrp/AsnC family transcriptional regulator [Gulosibacter sp.]|uniref:Lrp/AsnC family transcriptional regulator n=1 Tax=Gulosibacter sp. TaxID=2817531 RepID=UPI003F90388F